MILNHEHGKVSTECNHPDCKAALARWKKRWRLDRMRGVERTVPAEPVVLHIATLRGHDWTYHGIAGTSGVPLSTVQRIATSGRKRVLRDTAARLLALAPDTLPTASAKGHMVPTVSALGTIRRLRALQVMGWSAAEVGARIGLTKSAVSKLRDGNGRRVLLTTHERVAEAYRDLSHKRGPSELTARWALARGYVGPTAWDDIDHDAEPEDETLEESA